MSDLKNMKLAINNLIKKYQKIISTDYNRGPYYSNRITTLETASDLIEELEKINDIEKTR